MITETSADIQNRKLFIPAMTITGSRAFAAVYRSAGLDAVAVVDSDEETLDLGGKYTSGEECLPMKITLGDLLKVTNNSGLAPDEIAYFMPSANGPCRFGQYMFLMDTVLKKIGMDDVLIVSPSSKNAYSDIGGNTFYRKLWMAVVASDVIRKMLLKTRPYEVNAGDADAAYETAMQRLEGVLEQPNTSLKRLLHDVRDALIAARGDYHAVEAEYVKGKPLIGIVGEIFCRLNRFANENLIRQLEAHGAETWQSDVAEWVFYTDYTARENMKRTGKRFSVDMLTAFVKQKIMKRDEHFLLKPFEDEFRGYEEPESIRSLVKFSEPYLPVYGALGEMTLCLARSGYLHGKGADGIVDISPFTCMNGIVSEAVYPSFSRDHNNMPCNVFYFDGINADLDRDIGIFMELVRSYMTHKKVERVYPPYFSDPD